MNTKIHTLQVDIKAIENLLSSLDATMHALALEEVKNMRFELDMLTRTKLKSSNPQPIHEVHAEEAGVYA